MIRFFVAEPIQPLTQKSVKKYVIPLRRGDNEHDARSNFDCEAMFDASKAGPSPSARDDMKSNFAIAQYDHSSPNPSAMPSCPT
jgi:hypothetical protein